MLNMRHIQAETSRLVKAGHEAAFQGFAAIVAEAYAIHQTGKDAPAVKETLQKRMWDMHVDSPTISRYVKAALAFNRKASGMGEAPRLKDAAEAPDAVAYHNAIRGLFADMKASKVYTAIAWCSKADALPMSQSAIETLRGSKPGAEAEAKAPPAVEIGKPAGHPEPGEAEAETVKAEKSAAEKRSEAKAAGLKAIRDLRGDRHGLESLLIALNAELANMAKAERKAEAAKPAPTPEAETKPEAIAV